MSRTFDIVQAMSGQKNVIVLPRPYLKFFREDQQAHALAAVLNNLVFWSAFGSEDGWFYKSHKELGEAAGELSEDQTERLVKKLITKYLPGVIETCSRKVNGTPTKHYRIDGDSLIAMIFPAHSETAKMRNGKREGAESKTQKCGMETANAGNPGNREVAESFLYTDSNTDLDIQTNNPSCQVAGQPDRDIQITDLAKQVLTHLNQTTGAKFQVSKSSLENIRARIAEGYSADELCLVIDYKHEHWRDTEQEQYLRPATLFIPKNFPGYLQSATKWEKAGRPARLNGKWQTGQQRDITVIPSTDYAIPDGWRTA